MDKNGTKATRPVLLGRVVAALTLAIGLTASALVLWTPRPLSKAEGANAFSAVYAAEYIEVISREPHSVRDPDAHERVRHYLRTKLGELVGPQRVSEWNYTAREVSDALNEDVDYDVKNLLATIEGKSETGPMIVGHYDSRGHIGRAGELGRSYGAADDGYALAVILETARLFGRKEDLANSIYLLITDAEETGLYGARMIAREAGLLDKISFIVNLEARGVKGPAYMFETGPGNEKAIELYGVADYPVAYSLATAVYRVMPNSTDFAAFLAAGKTGLNFAVLDSLYYYHTPRDSYVNIDLSSLQHYGAQVMPIVRELAYGPQYSDPDDLKGTQDRVFFTFLPNLLVSYTERAAHWIHLATLVVAIGLIVFFRTRRQIEPWGLLKALGADLAFLAVFTTIAFAISYVIALLGKAPFSLTYVRMDGTGLPALAVLVGIVLAAVYLYARFVRREADRKAFAAVGIAVNLLLAILTGLYLSGASFLFFVPALAGLIGLAGSSLLRHPLAMHLSVGASTVSSLLLIVPILYSLLLALTVGGLAILAAILIVNLTVSLPVAMRQWQIE